MISYVIKAGKRATLLSNVYCSTDHDAIAEVCKEVGVEIIDRPEYLGRDDTPVADVIRHVLEILGERDGVIPGMVALLQPTSPFLLPQHIDACVKALKNNSKAVEELIKKGLIPSEKHKDILSLFQLPQDTLSQIEDFRNNVQTFERRNSIPLLIFQDKKSCIQQRRAA